MSANPGTHGHFAAADLEPPDFHRSEAFPRLGSVALNMTHCLHGSGTNIATCAHDTYGALFSSHANGDHYGNMYRHFIDYFAHQMQQSPDRYPGLDGTNENDVWRAIDMELAGHGLSQDVIRKVCAQKVKPLANATDLPAAFADLPVFGKVALSSICRFAPFLREGAPSSWDWGQIETHEGHSHDEDGYVRDGSDAFEELGTEAGDAFMVQTSSHSGHSGPHGVDFNTELNWIYVAMSHQQKVAIINLNVIDWSKVATYEEETGYRVLLMDETVMLDPYSVQHYASQLLAVNRGEERAFAESLDTVHRYCFSSTAAYFAEQGLRGWKDNLTAPASMTSRDPLLANATAYFAKYAPMPKENVRHPVHETGWACFLAFTGIDVRTWNDDDFTNPFCTFDTRHLGRYDHRLSPGRYSRANPTHRGDGDAWRCDWFVRYIEVTNDIEVRIRRPAIALVYEDPLVGTAHVDTEEALGPGQYIESITNISIGPHDIVYNPVNGMLYTTHYWQFNDPDIRMAADWTIHALDGNPGSPHFMNPYNTTGGPPPLSHNGGPSGGTFMDSEPYPIDVGGPIDGLHPVTVDVDVRNGRIFVANREANSISMLVHDGDFDLTSQRLEATLHGPKRFAVQLTPDMLRFTPRDMSLYKNPDSMDLPTPAQLSGRYEVTIPPLDQDCSAFDSTLSLPNGTGSQAAALCEAGLIDAEAASERSTRAVIRPLVDHALLTLIAERTPWPTLVGELRALLAVDVAEYPAASAAFLEAWEPRLRSADDRGFLRESLLGLQTVRASARTLLAQEILALAEDRLTGLTPAFSEELVDALARASGATGRLTQDPRATINGLVDDWMAVALSGDLLGFGDAQLDASDMGLFVDMVEPILKSAFVSGTPAWLAYCLTYSLDVVIADGPFPQGKESDNGLHPFHCDDVSPPHYPDKTPIQLDYVGRSNHHDVFIIREPIGPMIIDWWYEIRPRLLQPFDLWVNSGDGNIYVSNFGNHDNLPILRGWITLIQEGGSTPCILVSCLSVALLPPPTGFSENLLIDMDVMPHHLNVNPYTFEVFGGHLMGSYVRQGQFEPARASWTIPETHTLGSDLVPGSSIVPNPHPTGMAINPSTARLFMTHFMTPEPQFVALTGRMEDMTRYVSIMDMNNQSLLPDMVYGGDHHAVADQIRPPGVGVYEQPFYNRSMEINVAGRPYSGSPVLTADSSQSIGMFLRCTYFSFKLGTALNYTLEGDGIEVRPRTPKGNMSFDEGRCFNVFDIQPQLVTTDIHYTPSGEVKVFEDPNEDRTFWEYGEEHLMFGVVNLFLDPDNVPATLRVRAPHGRDRDRSVDAGLQASEELAAAWVELDTPGRAHVPQGVAPLAIVPNTTLAGPSVWTFAFEGDWHVENLGPSRPHDPDQMRVRVSWNATDGRRSMEVANWSSRNLCCDGFMRTRVDLTGAFTDAIDDRFRIDFEFDSIDALENERRGWAIAEVRLEDRDGIHENRSWTDLGPSLEAWDAVGTVNVTPVTIDRELRTAVAFRRLDDGTYATPDAPTRGTWGFDLSRSALRVEHGSATQQMVLPTLRGVETWPDGRDAIFAFVDGAQWTIVDKTSGAILLEREEPTEQASGVVDPVVNLSLVLLQRQDVERPERLGRSQQPYDEMIVEASVDGGVAWKTVWRRDSRDLPQPTSQTQRVDVTPLVHGVNGQRGNASDLRFRLRFDALDPVLNEFPGWTVRAPRLEQAGGVTIPLYASGDLPGIAPGDAHPRWHGQGDALRFGNARGTYAGLGGEGGAAGLACRLAHGTYGTWQGGCVRPPGSAKLHFFGRDLAGHVTQTTWHDGRGIALVEDTFQTAAFTERYWQRSTTDVAGVGHAVWVFDPSPDGQGDLIPEDTPVALGGGSVAGETPMGTGEVLVTRRDALVEVPPLRSNVFTEITELVTEAAAMVSDGPQYRRGFAVAGSDPDLEVLPEEYRKIVESQGGWLNASHVLNKRPPTPLKSALDALTNAVQVEIIMDCYGEPVCVNVDVNPPDLQTMAKDALRSIRMLIDERPYGMRATDAPDQYIFDGTPDVPQQATERLSHEFRFRRDGADVRSADFAFDFVARHRFEPAAAQTKPGLPSLDLDLLRWLVNRVALENLNFTRDELRRLLDGSNLTGTSDVTDQLVNDTIFLSTHTLNDIGYDVENLVDFLIAIANDLTAIDVPIAEILNDLDRAQMSLPTWGAGFSVNVTLTGPNGTRVLGARDGVSLTRELDIPVIDPTSDVRMTVSPNADRTADVRLGFDVGRFERIRAHFDDDAADELFPVSGNYTLTIETTIRSADAPAPGLLHEVIYGDLGLYVELEGANQAPDPGFAWVGPARVGQQLALYPQRLLLSKANLEDQDGFIRSYEWTFPASVGESVRLNGRRLVPDADASHADDLSTNAAAVRWGRLARGLTLTESAGTLRLRYDASGPEIPVPSIAFPSSGVHPITLTVTDDDNLSDSLTQSVAIAASARPPEILTQPIAQGDDTMLVAWQNNTGSLVLQARGRSIDLAPYLNLTNTTLDAVRQNVTLLRQRISALNATEFSQSTIDQAVTNGTEIVNRTIHDPLWPLDILTHGLLLRPGGVQVVSKQAEDATHGGVRAQILLGNMPEGSAVTLPLLDLDLGLEQLPRSLRMARDARQLFEADLGDICTVSTTIDLCDPSLEGIQELVLAGLLDPWSFRFALHPDVNGTADMNRTIVQAVLMDSSVGLTVLLVLDEIETVRNITRTPGQIVDRVLAENLTASLDPIVPVSPYLQVASDLQQRSRSLARFPLVVAGLESSTLDSLPIPLGEAGALARALGASLPDIDEDRSQMADLADSVHVAHAALTRHATLLHDAILDGVTQSNAELDAWAATAYSDIALGPIRERNAQIALQAEVDLARTLALSAEAAAEAEAAVWNVSAALNVTREWAEDWAGSIQANNTSAFIARVDATVNSTHQAAQNVTKLVRDVYDIIRDTLNRTLQPPSLEATSEMRIEDLAIVLGYDGTTGEAFVRVGDSILARGVVNGTLPEKVHASISFTSIANHTAEIQAYWGGRGAELRDGFNRDANAPRADNWTWTSSASRVANTSGTARTVVLEQTPPRVHEYLVARRSPEGLRATIDANASVDDPAGIRRLASTGLPNLLPESVLGIELAPVSSLDPADLLDQGPQTRRNGPRAHEKIVATSDAEVPVSLLPPSAVSPWRNDDATAYLTDMELPGGFLFDLRVGSGSRQRLSAPALTSGIGAGDVAGATSTALAPHILGVRSFWNHSDEFIQVMLQHAGNPADITHFDVFATPRPWPSLSNATGAYYVGTIARDGVPTPMGAETGEPGWMPGVDYAALEINASATPLPTGWRYVTAQAVTRDGLRSAFATPWRIPPTLLEEGFGFHKEGMVSNYTSVNVEREPGTINLSVLDLVSANLDTCLGDRVEVTRFSNFPHDMIAADYARSLRVQERGLDSLFMLLRALNRTINEIPLDLSAYDLPRVDVNLTLCPSVRDLMNTIGDVNASSVLGMIGYENKPDGMPIPNDGVTIGADMRLAIGSYDLLQSLLGNLSIDLDVSDLINGTPAQIQWRVPEPTGAYHARVRFMVPGPQLGQSVSATSIDRLLSLGNLGLFTAIVPGERFHLIELDHIDDETGVRTEVARVDFDPHLLAPLDVEGTAKLVDEILSLEKDPLGVLAAFEIPLSFHVAAGDTSTGRERIGQAMMDTWHTIDIYAPSPTADVYSVALDGDFVGQLRTSSRLPPNAIRIGGSNVPTEILVDDVRFSNAIHPPAAIAEVVKQAEAQPFAMVRWHVPEDGGAPLTDANLLRMDASEQWEVVATAASGTIRTLVDPDSHDQPVGTRYAYAVQPVNDLDDGAGLPSDARSVRLPGFLRASADTTVRHNHQLPEADDDVLEGDLTTTVGGVGLRTHRAVYAFNASGVIDADGKALSPRQIGGATFLTYALDSGEAKDAPVHYSPTLEELLMVVGYNRHAVESVNEVITIHTYEEAVEYFDRVYPNASAYVRKYYGDQGYADLLNSYLSTTRVTPIYCPSQLIPPPPSIDTPVGEIALGLGHACTDAFEEPIHFTSLCNDVSRDLEMQQLPFNCLEDTIGAFASPSTDYDMALTDWRSQPRTDFWSQDTGIDRQVTRMVAWRRYDVLPALRADDDGDFSLTLKKTQEVAPSAFARYATVEDGAWLDERIGPHGRGPLATLDPYDGKGPRGFPWSDDVASSGQRSVHLGGRSGVSSVAFGASGLTTVPLDVPIRFDVWIPEGRAPREIGIKLSAGLVDRRGEQNPNRGCSEVYGGVGGTTLITWGDEIARLDENDRIVVDLTGELDHAADLLAPRDGRTGHHVGGIPPQRGRWVTLTFDPAQLALEAGGGTAEKGLLGDVLDALYALRGPETNLWVPPHLADERIRYERGHPTSFVERIDSVDPGARDEVDYRPPYHYFIPPWLFFRFNYDKFVEPYLCGLAVGGVELFVVDGEAYIDRFGPDIAPRLRIDAGGPHP